MIKKVSLFNTGITGHDKYLKFQFNFLLPLGIGQNRDMAQNDPLSPIHKRSECFTPNTIRAKCVQQGTKLLKSVIIYDILTIFYFFISFLEGKSKENTLLCTAEGLN